MTDKNGSRPTPKALAIAALADAIQEAAREGGPRPMVLGALLAEARAKVEAVAELQRVRKVKAATEIPL